MSNKAVMRQGENGRLDYVPVVVNKHADIYGNDMIGMRQRANHFLANGTKAEKKLAKNLLACLNWMDREIFALQRRSL
jgi:hypothetical protein